ncbi:MAG: hypothetical protein WD512_14755 [Candidatus Paceibacterota bacterium]
MKQIILPQLVKEKIENYFYLFKWKKNIVKVNREYKENVTINIEKSGGYNRTQLLWCHRGEIMILEINYQGGSIFYDNYVKSWKNNNNIIIKDCSWSPFTEDYINHFLRKPKYYFYSSGMNDDSGYNYIENYFLYGSFMVL